MLQTPILLHRLYDLSWWRHHMETFSALLAICAGHSPVAGEFPAQRPVTRSFDVFFHLRLNKRLSKQPRGCWFGTPRWSLWRQWNVFFYKISPQTWTRKYTGTTSTRYIRSIVALCKYGAHECVEPRFGALKPQYGGKPITRISTQAVAPCISTQLEATAYFDKPASHASPCIPSQ